MRLGPFIDAYESITINISSSGSFSAAQPVLKLTRIGNVVTLTFPGLSFSSSSTPLSGAVIPAAYRPSTNVYTMSEMSSSRVVLALVQSTGEFGFIVRDWAGTATPISSALGGSLTWVI